jgi:hypothetical protein
MGFQERESKRGLGKKNGGFAEDSGLEQLTNLDLRPANASGRIKEKLQGHPWSIRKS